jgi:hypothetical protein
VVEGELSRPTRTVEGSVASFYGLGSNDGSGIHLFYHCYHFGIVIIIIINIVVVVMRARGNNEMFIDVIDRIHSNNVRCVCDNKELLFSPSFFLHNTCYMLHLLTTEIEFPFVVTTLLAPDA